MVIRDFNKSNAPESTIRSIADEALFELTETLSSSNAAIDRFVVNFGELNDHFEQDIAGLDAEVASIPPSLAHLLRSKKLKRKEQSDKRNSRKRLGLEDDVVSVASSSRASLPAVAVGGNNKLQSRQSILAEMEKMGQCESELQRKLLAASDLTMTDQERRETASTLLSLQIANADKLVNMITAYKPSFNAKKKRSNNKSRDGTQPVEEILSEVRASRAPRNTKKESE
jgi:hypothetical protein